MRNFSSRKRKVLFALSDGFCQICGNPLEKSWEADHVIPYSKAGKTDISNGQAVCSICNRKKSNKMQETEKKSLREWQGKCFTELLRVKADGRNTFLAVAGVGSGKTFFSAYVFDEFRKKGEFDSVVIISPTENIKRNWSWTFQIDFGIRVDHGYQFKHSWPRDCHGVSLTYHSLNPLNLEVLKRYINKRVLLIIDEVHHAGDERSWGDAIQELGIEAGFVLLLSGTPTRSDNAAIPFVTYKEIAMDRYQLQYDYYYGYADSIKDKVCCPTIFERNHSEAETFEGYKTLKYEVELETPESRRLLNGVLTAKNKEDCFIYQTFIKANKRLSEINDKRNGNSAGLIVCKSIEDAQTLYRRIYEEFGEDFAEIVTSDDKDSSRKIENFKTCLTPWLISINMVSEGVDIPRIRCIIYATNVTTMVRFMQIMGRGVRNPKHVENDNDVCYMYIPDYKPIVDNALQIEAEIAHIRTELMDAINKPRTNGGGQLSLDDVILSATSENSGNVFGGTMFDLQQDTKASEIATELNASKDIVLEIMKRLQKDSSPMIYEQPVQAQMKTITEERASYKQMINRIVGKLHYDFNLEYKDIHYKLNETIGRGKTSNILTLDELKKKYELSKQMYEQLKGKNNGGLH